MPKISGPSKSFIVLFALAIFGVVLCLSLWPDLAQRPPRNFNRIYYFRHFNADRGLNAPAPGAAALQSQEPAQAPPSAVDTSGWKNYFNKTYNLGFKYPPDWKVLAPKKLKGYDAIEVDPGKKFYNVKIYISPTDYFVFAGLPAVGDTLGGLPAANVKDSLYQVKAGKYYYTFDVGLSTSIKPDFAALVHSVMFGG